MEARKKFILKHTMSFPFILSFKRSNMLDYYKTCHTPIS